MTDTTRIVTFGNCQAEGLKRLLDLALPAGHRVEFFSNNWRTGTMRPTEDILGAIAEADLVVFQPLKASHGPLSGESVRAQINGVGVAFPYLFNAGISGLCRGVTPHRANGPSPRDSLGLDVRDHGLILGEEAIVARLQAGVSAEEIVQAYREGRIGFRLARRFRQCMTELARREASTELKLTDFIVQHHTRERLFLTHSHPTTALFVELCEQLATHTGLPLDLDRVRASEDTDAARLGRGQAPVSPHDVEEMGYEFPPDENWAGLGARLIAIIAEKFEVVRRAGLDVPEALDPGDAHIRDYRLAEEGPPASARPGHD